jgi:predicted RNA-binding protein with PIN domain
MPEQATSFVQESRERINSARERIDGEVDRIQKELRTRSERIEKQFSRTRKSFEKQTRKQVKQLERFDRFQADAAKQIESALASVLGALRIASTSDVRQVDRKIARLNKKLKDMERQRATNGKQPPAPQL